MEDLTLTANQDESPLVANECDDLTPCSPGDEKPLIADESDDLVANEFDDLMSCNSDGEPTKLSPQKSYMLFPTKINNPNTDGVNL